MKTSERLGGKAGNSETGDDIGEAAALGDADGVDHLIVVEHLVVVHPFLEQASGKSDFLGDRATVDLDLRDVNFDAQMQRIRTSAYYAV